MATVVFDDNGGGGDGLWSTATNWVGDALPGDADTAQISADCTLDMDDVIAALIVDSSMTLTINGYALTGITAATTNNGTIAADAGSQIGFTPGVYNAVFLTGKLLLSGTEASPVTVTNASNLYNLEIRPGGGSVLTWVNAQAIYRNVSTSGSMAFVTDCEFVDVVSYSGDDHANRNTYGHFFDRVFLGYTTHTVGDDFEVGSSSPSKPLLRNVAIGYARDGASKPFTIGLDQNGVWDIPLYTYVQNAIINATTEVFVSTPGSVVTIENYGYLPASMLPGTGSALDLAVVDAGLTKTWHWQGTSERSTSAKKAGDYGTRCTPSSNLDTNYPLEVSLYVPIASGDSLAVSVYGRRKTLTDGGTENTIAEIEIDPEGAWFTPTTSAAVAMTNEEGGSPEWYEFTASASTAGGTGAKGMCRVVLRVKQYTAGGYFDWADFVATVT